MTDITAVSDISAVNHQSSHAEKYKILTASQSFDRKYEFPQTQFGMKSKGIWTGWLNVFCSRRCSQLQILQTLPWRGKGITLKIHFKNGKMLFKNFKHIFVQIKKIQQKVVIYINCIWVLQHVPQNLLNIWKVIIYVLIKL